MHSKALARHQFNHTNRCLFIYTVFVENESLTVAPHLLKSLANSTDSSQAKSMMKHQPKRPEYQTSPEGHTYCALPASVKYIQPCCIPGTVRLQLKFHVGLDIRDRDINPGLINLIHLMWQAKYPHQFYIFYCILQLLSTGGIKCVSDF